MPNESNKDNSGFYNFLSNFLIFLGVFFGIVTSFAVLEFLFFVKADSKKLLDYILVLILMGVVPSIFGFILKKKYKAIAEKYRLRNYEQTVLRILANNDNYINATTLSLQSGISTLEAREILDILANQGVITPEIDEDGNIYYTCPQLLKRKN